MGKKLVIKGADFHSNPAVNFFGITKLFGVGTNNSNMINGYKKRVALFYSHIDNVLPLEMNLQSADDFYTKEEMESKGLVFSEFSPIPTLKIKSVSIKCKKGVVAYVNQYNTDTDQESTVYKNDLTLDINEKTYKYLSVVFKHEIQQIEPFNPSLKDYIDKFKITYTSGESVEL